MTFGYILGTLVRAMSKTIWKYPLQIRGTQIVSVPAGAQILKLDVQEAGDYTPYLWVLVDLQSDKREDLEISMYGTGHTLMDSIDVDQHIGTFITESGKFVWHAFLTDIVGGG